MPGSCRTTGGARAATGEGEGVGPGNVMGLLSLMGRDCPEAVSFLGVGEDPVPRASDYVEVDEGVLGLRLSELMDRGEASWQARAEHWSLGGVPAENRPRLLRRTLVLLRGRRGHDPHP